MKTPEEKFNNDPSYNALVSSMQKLIERSEFTPSEIREAAMYACIRHEMTRASRPFFASYRDELEWELKRRCE